MDNNFNNDQQGYQTPMQDQYGQPAGMPQGDPYNQVPGGDAPQGGAGLAIASMVLGICAVVLGCCIGWLGLVLGLVGLILGGVSLSKKTPGKGMAIAGLVLSIIAVAFAVIGMIAGAALLSSLQDLADSMTLFIK